MIAPTLARLHCRLNKKPGYKRKKVVYYDLQRMIDSVLRHKELNWTYWKSSFKFFHGQPVYTIWYFS